MNRYKEKPVEYVEEKTNKGFTLALDFCTLVGTGLAIVAYQVFMYIS